MNRSEFNEPNLGQLKNRLEEIRSKIDFTAKAAGRDPGEIDLIVVTKGKTPVIIKTLSELGIKNIGESYLKEAIFKLDLLRDLQINWHMIGQIQKNKVKQISYNFDVIHSVEKLQIAAEVNKRSQGFSKVQPVFLEVNLSGEDTKLGWNLTDSENLDNFLRDFEQIVEFTHLKILGLMTMAPYSENPEDSRIYFQKLREIRDLISREFPQDWKYGLSMGMSGDYLVAIEEGATVLRIGSAIVGPR
jgi:pyridoxal phosphate enzyme (YggS family)